MPPVFDVNYRPKAPWFGGDLQTLSAVLSPPRVSLEDLSVEALEVPTEDGSGDILLGQRLTGTQTDKSGQRPTVIVLHGLLGDFDRDYMRLLTRHFADAGYPVVRMNLRGAGASRPLCSRNYHGGFTDDLTTMARFLAARPDTGALAWVGISLSGNMLLKAASESVFVEAADHWKIVSVSAPFDMVATANRFSRLRNALYSRYLVNKIRKQMPFQPGRSPEQIAHLRRIRTIGEFDEHFTAPDFGYDSANAYYVANSAKRFVLDARVPCLVITAADDPWIDIRPYQAIAWGKNPLLTPALCRTGGHVGFHAAGQARPVYTQWSQAFFEDGASFKA